MRKKDELVSGCMAKADDDEMTFVLLARDPAAAATIKFWVSERIRLGKNKPNDSKIQEAESCAAVMENEYLDELERKLASRNQPEYEVTGQVCQGPHKDAQGNDLDWCDP